jgi:hypothetical protein
MVVLVVVAGQIMVAVQALLVKVLLAVMLLHTLLVVEAVLDKQVKMLLLQTQVVLAVMD